MPMTTGNRETATRPSPMPTQATKPLGLDDLQTAVQLGLIDHETLAKVLREKQKDDIVRNHRHAISQLRDGRWQTYYIHPKTKKRKDLRAKSREALIEKLFATVQEVENAAKPSPDELFEEWLAYREKLSNSPNSVLRLRQRYSRYLKGTELFTCPIDTITKISLEVFCNTLVKEHELTAKEYSNVKTIIKGLFEYAYDQEMIRENIFNRVKISVRFRQKKLKTGETETYSSDELALLQDYLLDAYHRTGDNAYIAVALNFYLGLRVGELVALKWSDITIDNGVWRVGTRMIKTERLVYVPLPLQARRWMPPRPTEPEKRNDKVFQKFDVSKIQEYLKPWAESAGITGKNVTFHVSRHTFATMLLTLGADLYTVSKLLGHTSVRHTQRYAKIINKTIDDSIELIDKNL